ncbi:Aldehyde oxidase and xanthine dehydrogenase molybdopterin binding [Mesorhizobium metallidurans STM 2683]|uniref:Aldehyde oxidase and xanthine dehydrogenase molybdopterin binding n=1 Tax=Mesorhizobium metallidurans STM 2683 TaxID=1297569 RepID=M5ERB8_9HYPH|nr:xanthine dehydrogenase family protein molybdopterin-binding subunit [Mesorhizobium metallidurans]CCV07339.1 Aldehyde oxidase and xanthine dehydrogenase molybdopterin binding [Mesorhizobium metallidurans STM 2683]
MSTAPFPDRARIDAFDKVRGATEYAADIQFPGLLYAMTVTARIAKGTMTELSTDAAMRVPGVVRVLTPDDFPPPPPTGGEDGPPPPPPTLEKTIAYRGQPVAVVVAETLEAAIAGAEAVRPSFADEQFSSRIDSAGAESESTEDWTAGDAAAAMAGAAVTIEATYESPTQHHNPIELLVTTAVWADGRLTIHECSQGVNVTKGSVAGALHLDPALIDVKSAYIGGGFGQKGLAQRQTALVAHAAMLTGRPVKLVLPRGQIFHVATYRPNSRHRIQLGADATGKMVAARYHAEHEQSRTGFFSPAEYHESPIRMYGIENYLGTAANIRIDRQAPGYMRAPHPQASCFAFESAVDELAYKLDRDPVAFRIENDTKVDPKTGHPLSSRFLNECLTEGARRFGWSRRSAAPGSMTASDGTQIGWGVAAGCYPSMMPPAIATLRIGANGSTRFATSGHEMGQGIRTAIAAVLLDGLDINTDKLDIVIGDTTAAPQHMTAGSWGTAGAVPVAAKAVERMRAAVSELLAGRTVAGNLHRQLASVRRPYIEIEVSQVGAGQNNDALAQLREGGFVVAGPEFPEFTTMSYIAHFVEVHVEPHTRRIRMPRVVSIADCGRVISPRTAASQVRGGVVWAFSAALREATEIDRRYGGYLNNDLADYVVAVNADIGEIEVGFVDQPDPLANSMGLKGLGEVAMVGASPAIANAIFHATGKRMRELPIRIEHLL